MSSLEDIDVDWSVGVWIVLFLLILQTYQFCLHEQKLWFPFLFYIAFLFFYSIVSTLPFLILDFILSNFLASWVDDKELI